MIASLYSLGRTHFALSHSNTDQDTFMLFMRRLVRLMDIQCPGWQESSIIVIDNAPYHCGDEIRDYLHKMQIPIMYSAPYSYSSAPIETLFSFLKLDELNQDGISTGKKNLQGLTNIVAKKLSAIPLNTRIKLWYHSSL